jgi:hypothetical protein
MQTKQFNAPLRIKSLTDEGEFEGYGSVFNVEDYGGDVIAPGAFKASLERLQSKGRMPAMLWQHKASEPIGVFTKVEEDATGLHVVGRLLIEDDPLARRAHAHLKHNSISGMSIGYVPERWEWDDTNDTRTLLEVDLWEVSLVTFPMNDEARVQDVKSIEAIETIRQVETYLRDSKGCTKGEAQALIARLKMIVRREAEEKDALDAVNNLIEKIKE